MKKSTTHSSLLGLTQYQMALLLQVHTSQWSMYESGKRNLPLKAKQALAMMLGFLKFGNKGLKVQQHIIQQEELKKKCIEKLLKKNEFELFAISKKIESTERRYNNNINIIGLIDYLNALPSTEEVLGGDLLQIISSKAENSLSKSGLADLTMLRIKEELLQQEKLLLNSELNKIS